MLSANPEKLTEAVTGLQDEIFRLKGVISSIEEKQIDAKAEDIPEGQPYITIFEPELSSNVHRYYVNKLIQKCSGICGVFVGNDEDGYRYIIGSSSIDVREINNIFREKLGAKGGGKPEMVQGSLCGTKAEINSIIIRMVGYDKKRD